MRKIAARFVKLSFFGALLSLAVPTLGLAQTELLVYAASPPEEVAAYEAAFEKDHPEIDLKWVVDSTGVIAAKLLAEKNNRQADVVWAMSVAALINLDKEGMLDPYAPVGIEALDSKYVDPQSPPHWVGRAAWATSINMNTVEAAASGLPAPATWKDLIDPVYEGRVVMPNPASSGTGYLTINAWIQMWGEEEAWNYMDALHKNISFYTHSGSKPAKLAAAGEIVFGISLPAKGVALKKKGAPLEVIIPEEGIGWDLEAGAIIKGTQKMEAARTLMDWNASINNVRVAAQFNPGVAIPNAVEPIEGFPMEVYDRMISINFMEMSENKGRILDEWLKRYDGKSVAKN